MNVIKCLDKIPKYHHKVEPTIHFNEERKERLKAYVREHGRGIPVIAFLVDKGHINGQEVHIVCDNRLVYVYNFKSQRLITVLYARHKQVNNYGKSWLNNQLKQYETGWNTI